MHHQSRRCPVMPIAQAYQPGAPISVSLAIVRPCFRTPDQPPGISGKEGAWSAVVFEIDRHHPVSVKAFKSRPLFIDVCASSSIKAALPEPRLGDAAEVTR